MIEQNKYHCFFCYLFETLVLFLLLSVLINRSAWFVIENSLNAKRCSLSVIPINIYNEKTFDQFGLNRIYYFPEHPKNNSFDGKIIEFKYLFRFIPILEAEEDYYYNDYTKETITVTNVWNFNKHKYESHHIKFNFISIKHEIINTKYGIDTITNEIQIEIDKHTADSIVYSWNKKNF